MIEVPRARVASDINVKLKAAAGFIWLGVHIESFPD